MKRRWMPLVCMVVCLAAADRALADGAMLNGVSPRSIGRGGTNLGFSDNGAVLYDNPAGAVNVEGAGLMDLGVDLLQSDFRYTNPRNGVATDSGLTPLPQISIIRKSADQQWAYGLGVFVPSGFSQLYHLNGPDAIPGEHTYRSFGLQGKILPGVSYRVDDRLSIGATLGVGVSHIELEGPYFLQTAPLRGLPTQISLRETGAALVWSAGFQYEITDGTRLGGTYQSPSRYDLHGRTKVEVENMGSSSYESAMDVIWPQTVGLGVRHELCPHQTIAADVVWTSWSTAFDNFGLYLNNPSNPWFPTFYEQIPLHWSDSVSVRLGYERAFEGGRTFRCGYIHHQNPIPEATLTPFIQAIPEHAFTVGFGWNMQKWQCDVSYMYAFSSVLHVGTSDFAGGDFDNSTHRAQFHLLGLSLLRQF